MTAADRIVEIFDAENDIVDGELTLSQVEGRVRFDGVSFRFPDADAELLHGVDLDIAPGETVALVGATGSGKTVLTQLVARLYDVTAGAVTIDGVDVRDLRLSQLRSIVATAFEDPTLFSMSVRENLTLGRPDATAAEIDAAIEIAQAQFVHDLPWGLQTRIGEQGMSLSGGQRQRLALARAVLAQPAVLVLDDTLSSLDIHTEALVEEALRRVLAGVTGIVVAHRASTVLLADRVALLSGGTVTQVGTHRDLLERVPEYRALLSADAGLPRQALTGSTRVPPGKEGGVVTAPADERETSELEQWRGVAAEHSDEITERAGIFLRRRSRALLADLLRPYGSFLWVLVIAVVIENAARLSLPWLVHRGIDYGVPPLVSSGDAQVLYQTVGLMLLAVLIQSGSRMFFLRKSGRVGQAVLLELRRRVFRHFQRLDVQFHDRYTSGRVVSRLTNDTTPSRSCWPRASTG